MISVTCSASSTNCLTWRASRTRHCSSVLLLQSRVLGEVITAYEYGLLYMCRFDDELAAYVPRPKDWIKTQVFAQLKRMAAQK